MSKLISLHCAPLNPRYVCFAKLRGFEPLKAKVKTHPFGRVLTLAGTECEVANTSTPVFVITDKTLKSIEKLVESLKKLGIKDVNGELVYDEEEAGYEYLQ